MLETLPNPPVENIPNPHPDLAAFPGGENELQPDAFEGNPDNPTEAQTNQPEQTEAETRDIEARYTDAELLGKSFRVRRTVQEAGTQSIKTWQGIKARVRNAFDAPGKALKQFAHNRAKSSFERKDRRLQKATSARLVSLRQASAEKAKGRLDERANKLHEHVGRMEARTNAVQENANRRRQGYIDELKGRRENGLARKAVRQQLRSEGASRRETRAIIGEKIPAEHLQRVGKVAIVAETSRRKSTEAERGERKAVKSHARTERRIATTNERARNYADHAETTDLRADEITDQDLPFAEQQVADIKAKLETEEADSPVHDLLIAELQESEQKLADLQWQVQYLRDTAVNSRQKVDKSEGRLNELHLKKTRQTRTISYASGRVNSKRHTDNLHKAWLNQEVTIALNSDERTRKVN